MSEDVVGSLSPVGLRPEGYEALRTGAALVESRSADWLRLTGSDRLRFTNGLVSCDLRSLSAGDGEYGFFTDPKGKVIADAAFFATESELWIELARGRGAPIAEHMGKYLVADQVEIEALGELKTVFAAGREAAGKLAAAFGRVPQDDPWSGLIVEVDGSQLVIRSERRLGVPAWVLAGSRETLARVTEGLAQAGLRSAGAAAVASLRIEQGVPWFGLDFGADAGGGNFPQETGIEDWAVNFDKGCYLGQEVVARIHFRGKVSRSLRGLVFEPDSEPRAGVELVWNDQIVGVMNSVAGSPAMGCPIGLAIVHRKAESGADLSTPYGPCRLVDLPFDTAVGTGPTATT